MTDDKKTKRTRTANGHGHFFPPLPDGSIRFKVQHGYLENGNPRMLTVTGKTKAECIRLMNQKIADFEASSYTRESVRKMTLTELVEAHLQYDIQNGLIEESSADRREVTIKNQISNGSIGHKQIASLAGAEINDYILYLRKNTNLSASSIKKAIHVIDAAYNWAFKRKYVEENPLAPFTKELFQKIEKTEPASIDGLQVKTLTDAQVKAIEDVCRIRNANNGNVKYPVALYVMFLIRTGMRVGELCALRWKDIEKEDGRVIVIIEKSRNVAISRTKNSKKRRVKEGATKNKKHRRIELDDKAIECLDRIEQLNRHHVETDYFVLNSANKPTDSSKFVKRINTVYRRAGLPEDIGGAHVLRRTFATTKFNNGARIEMIAEYIGDLTSTVERYYINKKSTLDREEVGRINYVKKL